MADWSDDELRAAVGAFLSMLAAQERGETYSKADVRKALLAGSLRGRSAPSVEYRMRNISSVMEENDRPVLSGYRPAPNVGAAVRARIWNIIREESLLGDPDAGRVPPPMIYFNIGWMKSYRGATPDERTLGAHGYLKRHRYGAESFNFLPVDGRLQGYRPGHRQGIRIDRLGAHRGDQSISGVTVIWMARHPASGSTRIVGWYRNATVHRESQYRRQDGRRINGELVRFSAETALADARLLPVEARQFEVPSNHRLAGGFGQSPIWYGTEDINRRVWRFIRDIDADVSSAAKRSNRSRKPPKSLDPELRRRVERAAVDHAVRFYTSAEGGSCTVKSVEADAAGWDLRVERPDGSKLLVEVKGLQGSRLVCELTPNEYEKMQDPTHRDDYIVYVVCNALTLPIASVFHHAGEGAWATLDGRILRVEPRTAAILSCEL